MFEAEKNKTPLTNNIDNNDINNNFKNTNLDYNHVNQASCFIVPKIDLSGINNFG